MYSQSNNGAPKRRTPYRVIAQIGMLTSYENGATKTSMVQQLDLTCNFIRKYTYFLIKNGLLEAKIKVGIKDRIFYFATPKMIDFIYASTVIHELCKKGSLRKYYLPDFEFSGVLNDNEKKVNGKYKKPNLNWMNWYADIIRTLGNDTITVFKVRDRCGDRGSTDKQIKRYLKNMREIGFLQGDDKSSLVADKGRIFLQFYNIMNNLLYSDWKLNLEDQKIEVSDKNIKWLEPESKEIKIQSPSVDNIPLVGIDDNSKLPNLLKN